MYAKGMIRRVRSVSAIVLVLSFAAGCVSVENQEQKKEGDPLKGVADVFGGMIEGTGAVVGGAGAVVLGSGVVLGEAIGEVLLIPFGPNLQAPDFTLEGLEGGESGLEDFKGHPVVLAFWEPTFSSCRAEMIHLEELHKKYKSKDLKIVGIVFPYDRQFALTKKFVKEAELTFPILKGNEQVLNAYTEPESKRKKLPMTVFIDSKGNIVKRQIGFSTITLTTGEGKNKKVRYTEVNNRFEEEIIKLLEE